MADLSPEAVTRRLRAAGALYRPVRVGAETDPAPSRDLSPETVTARLHQLAELLRVTEWLQGR